MAVRRAGNMQWNNDCSRGCATNVCNAPCQSIYLEIAASPDTVSHVGDTITWQIKASNISGKNIKQDLDLFITGQNDVVFLGTGMNANEVIQTTLTTQVTSDQLLSPFIITTGYVVGTTKLQRLSNVASAQVAVIQAVSPAVGFFNPTLLITIETGFTDIFFSLDISNNSDLGLNLVSLDLTAIFGDTPISVSVAGGTSTDWSAVDGIVSLLPGKEFPANAIETISVTNTDKTISYNFICTSNCVTTAASRMIGQATKVAVLPFSFSGLTGHTNSPVSPSSSAGTTTLVGAFESNTKPNGPNSPGGTN